MTRFVIAPLVGLKFRPPASQVLSVLPSGTPLRLQGEPDNVYDPKALRVYVAVEAIPPEQREALIDALEGTGFCIEDLDETEEVWLGYVADSDGGICKKEQSAGNREIRLALTGEAEPEAVVILAAEGRLEFDPQGRPRVSVARCADLGESKNGN